MHTTNEKLSKGGTETQNEYTFSAANKTTAQKRKIEKNKRTQLSFGLVSLMLQRTWQCKFYFMLSKRISILWKKNEQTRTDKEKKTGSNNGSGCNTVNEKWARHERASTHSPLIATHSERANGRERESYRSNGCKAIIVSSVFYRWIQKTKSISVRISDWNAFFRHLFRKLSSTVSIPWSICFIIPASLACSRNPAILMFVFFSCVSAIHRNVCHRNCGRAQTWKGFSSPNTF